jgi:hypothetical protein
MSVEWDPQSGDAAITFGGRDELRINVKNDADCTKLRSLGPRIQQMVRSEQADRAAECAQSVKILLAGEVPKKGDIVGDPVALRRHVAEWCPASFDQQLRQAGK